MFGGIKMDKNQHFIWMPLIGFDRDKDDKGVSEFLDNADFVPEAISVFLFHSDIINQHENMDKEFVLHPDNCSYYGSPRNEFRERQDWTNYDLRTLANNLSSKGIDAFLGVMGVYLEDTRHKEWESEHKELLSFGVNGKMNLNVLKRFKDGTYYEDFFADKVVKTTLDYGFAGLHVSDFFCPPEHSIVNGDFSADMIDQFVSHTGVKLPEDILNRLEFDETADICARQEYIWNNLRREWIDFYAWRWEKFWSKICSRLHAVGKKVMINNAWCSDPFEALYRYGIDYKRFYNAGVDYIVAETVATGLELLNKGFVRFNQFMTMAQLMAAFNPDNNLHALLGVKDCTEEWDVLHHAPTRLERDMFTLATLYQHKEGKIVTSLNGYMVTLGDGITKDEWKWINERTKLAFEALPEKTLTSTVVWSDYAHYKLLDQYIETRRPSLHKQMYELKNRNASFGAVTRTENIDLMEGTLFVPNFDLCSAREQEEILKYNKGPVICTAPIDFIRESNINFDLCIEDKSAVYKMCVVAYNLDNANELINKACSFLDEEMVVNEPEGNPKFWVDERFFKQQMPFRIMSDGFLNACAYLINNAHDGLFKSDGCILPVLMGNGKYRIYVFNNENMYVKYTISSARGIANINNVSKYPVMPPRFVYKPKEGDTKFDGAKAESMTIGMQTDEIPFGFVAKVPPYGVSVFDVTVSDV